MAEQSVAARLDYGQPWRVISTGTLGVTLGAVVAVAVVQTAAILAAGDKSLPAGIAATWGGIGIEIVGASAIMTVASRMPFRAARRTWWLMGLAMMFAAIWDTDWTYHLGAPLASTNPWEVRGLLGVLVVAFGTSLVAAFSYAFRFRDRVDMRVAGAQASIMGVAAGFASWFFAIRPGLELDRLPSDQSMGYLAASLGSIIFAVTPVFFVCVVLAHVRDPEGNRPDWMRLQSWGLALVAVSLCAGSSLGWFVHLTLAPWAPGLLMDFFYNLGFVTFAVSACLEFDRQRALVRARDSSTSAAVKID